MKINGYTSSLLKWVLIGGICLCGCEIKKEPEEKYHQVKPIENAPVKIKKEENPKPVIDSITPSDSLHFQNKDTTETFQQMEKRHEKKVYKKVYLYSLYKKPLIS